jgi:NAD(P)-dependent dehydrogenase (short-subunit alcohol dehydrogenase family)
VKLKDRVAIITGGGSGIGRATSLAFAREGAKVVAAARNLSRLEEVVKAIKAKGGQAKAIQTDISDYEQIKRLVAQTIDEFGQVDILVNNAAAMATNQADTVDMNLDNWYNTLAVSLTGTMLCAREVLKNMIPRKSGSIVNVSSVAGLSGVPKENPYATTKWGVIGFTETLAIEVGKHNIRVNSISPGATLTDEFDEWIKRSAKDAGISYEKLMAKLTDYNALKRAAKPEEIANCIVFLASDDASAMTGANLVASCGFHIVHPNMISLA